MVHEAGATPKPSPGEVQSWQNSLTRMSLVLQKADLTDQGVILEHQLPLSSKRLDCMVLGQDADGQDEAVAVEPKQRSMIELSDVNAVVVTYVSGRARDVSSTRRPNQFAMPDGAAGGNQVTRHGTMACNEGRNAGKPS